MRPLRYAFPSSSKQNSFFSLLFLNQVPTIRPAEQCPLYLSADVYMSSDVVYSKLKDSNDQNSAAELVKEWSRTLIAVDMALSSL